MLLPSVVTMTNNLACLVKGLRFYLEMLAEGMHPYLVDGNISTIYHSNRLKPVFHTSSSPGYQENSFAPPLSSQGFKGAGTDEYFSTSSHVEDSGEWVWSDAAGGNDKTESRNIAKKGPSNEIGDNLLIDFGDKKNASSSLGTKTSTTAVTASKIKTAEEEAWDTLNS